MLTIADDDIGSSDYTLKAADVRHVAKDQVSVEFTDGTEAIAQLVPISKFVSLKNFASIMAVVPLLGEDAESFAMDVESVRNSFKEVTGHSFVYTYAIPTVTFLLALVFGAIHFAMVWFRQRFRYVGHASG